MIPKEPDDADFHACRTTGTPPEPDRFYQLAGELCGDAFPATRAKVAAALRAEHESTLQQAAHDLSEKFLALDHKARVVYEAAASHARAMVVSVTAVGMWKKTDLPVLRAQGWSVAAHNDYRLNGESYTFWLLTHPSGRYVKGEGRTDEEALAYINTVIRGCSP